MQTAAIGFSDHSGWAVYAVVAGAPQDAEFVLRRKVVLCPPELPCQAFHAVAEQGAPRSVIEQVEEWARELAAKVFREVAREQDGLAFAGVAMGRTRVPRDLDRILASHTLLHTAEGELYRDALSEAAAGGGLRVVRFPNREVLSEAAAALGCSRAVLEERLAGFGKSVGPPWTKDEKAATAAAMLALTLAPKPASQ